MRATRTELTGPRDKSKRALLVDLEASEQVRSINHERKHGQRRNARNKLLTANEDICHPRESCSVGAASRGHTYCCGEKIKMEGTPVITLLTAVP